MRGYLLFLTYFYFLSSFISSSPVSTSENLTPRGSPSAFINGEKFEIFKCNEIFKKHLEEYTIRTRFFVPKELDDFYADVFIKAVLFAARASPSFDEVIFDSRISVTFHCFLLEYFLAILRQENERIYYSQFIRKYSNSIAVTHQAKLEHPHVINVHVFPLFNELVLTGNFLNYSFLLSTCVGLFDSVQKDQIYTSHCLQYFYRLNEKETLLDFEVFKCGLEFLNLYMPRCEILSLAGMVNYETAALLKPAGYYLVAFNPLRAAVEGRVLVDSERVTKTPLVIGNQIEFFHQLESFLNEIEFNKNFEQFETRKSVLNAFINLDNLLLLVNCGYITCFQTWIQFQYTAIDDWTKLLLKSSCYGSTDQRFKEIFDKYLAE